MSRRLRLSSTGHLSAGLFKDQTVALVLLPFILCLQVLFNGYIIAPGFVNGYICLANMARSSSFSQTSSSSSSSFSSCLYFAEHSKADKIYSLYSDFTTLYLIQKQSLVFSSTPKIFRIFEDLSAFRYGYEVLIISQWEDVPYLGKQWRTVNQK